MNVSINTAIFLHDINNGKSQLDCLQQITNLPIETIEVRGELFVGNTKDKELAAIDQLCMDNNWNFFYSIPEQLFLTDHVNSNMKNYLEMAQKNHISQLKISLGDLWNITDKQLTALKSLLEQFKIVVTIENEPNDNGILENFETSLIRLKTAQVPLGYTFDSGNWYWIYESPSIAFKQLQDDITVFHLKDIKMKNTVMLGQGATNWEAMLRDLSHDVPVILEYDIPDDQLESQIKLVNQLLSNKVKQS